MEEGLANKEKVTFAQRLPNGERGGKGPKKFAGAANVSTPPLLLRPAAADEETAAEAMSGAR